MARKIILVHGLGGTKDGTWGLFPELLTKDKDLSCEVLSCGYTTPIPEFFSPRTYTRIVERAPSLLNIANGILTYISEKCDLEKDEIILAGHSLGGVILKKVLLILNNRNTTHNIKKVCFFDVPHDGSTYANVGSYILPRNRHLKSLTRDSSELDDLTEQWSNSNLNNELDILSILAENDDIVSSSSSKSIFRDHPIKTILETNHRTIVKPENSNAIVYGVFKKFILKKNTILKYKNSASRDLEDWKSIERNHAFHFASDELRTKALDALTSELKLEQQSTVRLVGASGLGKTRLLLQAIEVSKSINDNGILVYDAPGYEKNIKESIKKMVEYKAHGLVIIENCGVELHNHLSREIRKAECSLKLITVGYTDEQVDDSIFIQLSPMSDESIVKLLSPILIDMKPSDVERVARFAQGYPLMATLIAEQYQKEGRLLGSIETRSIVRKLIDSGGDITNDERNILSACALFDVFGTEQGTAGEEAKYIAEYVAGSNLRTFDRVISIFHARQIINRAGRYARVVPKPLALTLASDWWEEASYDRQKSLIDSLPDSLMHSFCAQASYLDNHPSVQRFTDKLFGETSPFIQAEVLLTERGSKLFRAFVEINHESTSNALYHVLSQCNHTQLKVINGNTRRNLVWALEKLCFHENTFEKSSWCLLLLATAENETWSNNAVGIFTQLFKIDLSGTQASPQVRFDILRKAIDIDEDRFDSVVIEALSQAIQTSGGSRTVGAEYQGTKAPLKEWRATVWQEKFDFWQQAFDLMLLLLPRGESQKEKILTHIGQSIRRFVRYGRIEMLDTAIKTIVSTNGPYWPAALSSIKSTFQYNSADIDQETADTLNNWLELLNPTEATLEEKLRILIINPPTEMHKDQDGHYIDVAERNAIEFAAGLTGNIDELASLFNILLSGVQKQTNAFGYQLALGVEDPQTLLDTIFRTLISIENPNLNLVVGVYRGIYKHSQDLWEENIQRLVSDRNLVKFYPHFLRTGEIKKHHLDTLLQLVVSDVLSPTDADLLSYGSVTEQLEPREITDFCLELSEIGVQGSWTALNIIYMYCFHNKDRIEALKKQLKVLVAKVPLHKGIEGISKDGYHWHDLAEKLLVERDEDFAIAITEQLINASKYGLDHGDIWSYVKPLMLELMKNYGDSLWPIFGNAIVRAEGLERYWLQQLLDRESGLACNMPSVLSVLPIKTVIDWCNTLPDLGPVFVARCLNIFDKTGDQMKPSKLLVALLESFGSNPIVTDELRANFGTRGWSGSLVPYLNKDKLALAPLLEHENRNVRGWAKEFIAHINQRIDNESIQDEERGFKPY
ncbi:alpha/beta hydrolase [Vibrio splendidus]|uniref:Alpha/beta hydrolase n=1 Tax=Vibrio splendidus TaxID=29497 RepID=A0AA43FZH8_VIBSP|nr:hypothetical protein [Vibrio splendidus]MDH5922810.1 alpha/beta hydrolase [Vibrio splendidus]